MTDHLPPSTTFAPHPDDVLVECVGGAHDRIRFWSRRPPRTFHAVAERRRVRPGVVAASYWRVERATRKSGKAP